MITKGVAIKYGDVAPEAKENFFPESSESAFGDAYKNQLRQYNLDFPNYANPCELYSVVLDGSALAFPSMPELYNLGLWSNQLSGEDGVFETPIVLELTSVGQYSSQGITLTFDTYNDIFATRVGIKWMRITDSEITTLAEEEFVPTSAFYFCRKAVENYNKIVITFYSINMPKNRLKLKVIDYGYGTVFYGEELRKVKVIQEIDPLSTEIIINPIDFTLDSKSDMDYSFQAKQPLTTYFNGRLLGTTFVKSSSRKSKSVWDINSEDYIGLMDSIPYPGGMYKGKDAYNLFEDIFAVAKVPYKINEKLKGVLLYGYIPYTTCRDACMQVAFAVQNVIDTSNSETVNVFELENDVKQTIPLNRIMQGQNFSDEETVTGVEVSAHTYTAIEETMDAYNANESGTGQNIFVKFSEPLHSLIIGKMVKVGENEERFEESSDAGEIVSRETNYAIINANEGCVLRGKKYDHTIQTKRKNNPVVSASEIEKIVAVENATLVSANNIDNILEKCYNWFMKTGATNLKIVEGKHVTYGDYIKFGEVKFGEVKFGEKMPNIVTYDAPVEIGQNINAETEYLGVVSGRIIKQSFGLNGNIIVKEAVLK